MINNALGQRKCVCVCVWVYRNLSAMRQLVHTKPSSGY